MLVRKLPSGHNPTEAILEISPSHTVPVLPDCTVLAPL